MDIVLNCNYVNRILVNHDYYNNGMNKYINLYVAVYSCTGLTIIIEFSKPQTMQSMAILEQCLNFLYVQVQLFHLHSPQQSHHQCHQQKQQQSPQLQPYQ